MPATSSLRDCAQLVTATQEAGGQIPKSLASILAGAHLLNTRPAPVDPAHTIVRSAVDGSLTEAKLNELLVTAANQQTVNAYAGDVRQRSERMFTEEFHRALRNGACDELLDSLRPTWDEHAQAVAKARGQINPQSSAEHILASGDHTLVECWQSLDRHLGVLERICAIARQFGPQLGNFPMVEPYANADTFRLNDTAIWCAAGNLERDSAAFRQPGTHRQSPLFAVPLRLNTLDEAAERLRVWSCEQWEEQHSGPRAQYLDEDGQLRDIPQPPNPYRETKLADR